MTDLIQYFRNWQTTATMLANLVRREHRSARAGAMRWVPGWSNAEPAVVLFGNDGYETDPRTQSAVDVLRELLDEHRHTVLAFSTNTDINAGESWAMIIDDADGNALPEVFELLKEAKREAWSECPDAHFELIE